MDQLLSWVVFPIAAVAICFGVGALAARLARVPLAPALVPALGFATSIAVLGIVFATGAGAVPALALLVVLAVAGLVAGGWARPGLGAAVGAAAYVLHIAPEALTGKATFLGYDLLNDTAIHLALVDWIGGHGSRYTHQPPGSYGATINDYVGSRYPLGSHELLAALKPLVGVDPALVYQPFLALCAGLAAAGIYALLRPALGARVAAAGGLAAMAGQLVFSFALQGSIKELAFVVCLVAAAGLAAELRGARGAAGGAALVALPAVALFGIYGLYALPWIAPLALTAWLLARPPLRALATGVAVFLAGIAVLVPGAIHYYHHGHNVITSGQELGPLGGPLEFVQVAGVWLGGDYRFTPAHAWITYVLAGLVLAAALAGVLRRSPALLMLAVPALVAYLVTSPSSSPYIDAKLLMVLSPAVIAAAVFGLASLPRAPGLALAALLGVALLASDALAYRMALPAPMSRLNELARIDSLYADKGPLLVNEYEEYVKHFMRHSPGSEPYETWTGGRAQMRDPSLPVGGHEYDLNQLTTAFVERWRYIVLRRSPLASRPPSNYDRVWGGRWYEVWQRVRPAPVEHQPLNGPLDCSSLTRLARRGTVVAALRPASLAIPLRGALPAGWYRYGPDPSMLEIHKGGVLPLGRVTLPRGRVTLWLRGRVVRHDSIVVGRQSFAVPRMIQRVDEWVRVGSLVAGSSPVAVELRRPRRSLRPGDAQPDVVGPLVAVADGAPSLVRGAAVRRACGHDADWIDVLEP